MFIVDKCVSSILISNKSLRFYSGNKDVKPVSNNWSKSLSFVLTVLRGIGPGDPSADVTSVSKTRLRATAWRNC